MKTLAIATVLLVHSASTWAQVTERVDVGLGGVEANFGADLPYISSAVVSADGRYVAFSSPATNLVAGDTNGAWDVFVRDRLNGTTERVSIGSNGAQGNGNSSIYGIALSADARYVAFESPANTLVPGDTNGARDIFVRDRATGTTERVSVDSNGVQANGSCYHLAISADGRFIAFDSLATNLVPNDLNGLQDVFLHDRSTGLTEIVSVSAAGVQGNSGSESPALSTNGRYVSFDSTASNLVGADTNGRRDIFVRDRQIGLTIRVSRDSIGAQGNLDSFWSSISADGHFVAFASEATNLVPGDTNNSRDMFVRDLVSATTERVSVATGGGQGNSNSSEGTISLDGRYVAYFSGATNLVPNAIGGQVYVHDRQSDTTEAVSFSNSGAQANDYGDVVCISEGGRYVVFRSGATNLVTGDTNGYTDVYVHDRFAAGFASMCDSGADNVIACPCGNQPSSPGRGCDNSSSTGGASLAASGNAYLSIDSLVFTTSDEKPSATSVVLQGDTLFPTGIVFGQGVRCVNGALKRLYIKPAVSGSITAPDFNAGDLTVSARSAQLGAAIQSGETRYYLVYYRDPIVLGGCPGPSTFNATQTGSVTWWP